MPAGKKTSDLFRTAKYTRITIIENISSPKISHFISTKVEQTAFSSLEHTTDLTITSSFRIHTLWSPLILANLCKKKKNCSNAQIR